MRYNILRNLLHKNVTNFEQIKIRVMFNYYSE